MMWDFIEDEDGINVVGWDGFNGDDNIHIGSIFKHTDGYFWFEPSVECIPLSCSALKTIFEKLSMLNTEIKDRL